MRWQATTVQRMADGAKADVGDLAAFLFGTGRVRNNVSKALRRVFSAAGVQWAGTDTFRRTVASWMDEAGCSLAEIAYQLGHADVDVTAGYLGRRTKPTRAADVMVLSTVKAHPHAV